SSQPPPPPPSLTGFISSIEPSQDESPSLSDLRSALFSEINKGPDITKGLKKVTADMQTHKNPALRLHEPVVEEHVQETKSGVKVHSKVTGPPLIQCEGGKKWIIENHVSNQNITVQIADMKQVVYIYNCVDSLVQLKGKANSVTLDNCKRLSLVFENLVSSVEVINCQKVQIQTLGTMPTVTIQNTDGCQIYLSKESLNAEIVSSRSSEMNMLVPDNSGEFHEFNIPEQFKSVWNGRKVDTFPADLI
ncbi:unnamed protein product, partial [Soboliphyme baturini]|uniref:Adenylyl cyclase-associated protein n=1 Tax=Soboliphyme baturini TaxID=241478 RepID=A0A183ITX7_9BILA